MDLHYEARICSSYSKQVEKNRNKINKITFLIQSLQKQANLAAAGQSQSIKQVQSQLSQLQKQIRKDIQKIKTAPATKARKRKSAPVISTRSRSKKSRSVTSARIRRRMEKK